MNQKNKPNILIWLLLLYILLLLAVVIAFIHFFFLDGFSAFSVFLIIVIALAVYIFFKRIFIPLSILQKEKPAIEMGKNSFNNSWETLNNLLSGAWIQIMEENTRLLEKDYANQVLLNKIRFRILQSQINPHFLYNALDSIRGLALIESSPKTAEMSEALGAFFRYNISHSISIVELECELQNIENYFIIQKYRFSNRFKLEYDFDRSDTDILKYPIPKLTIQPLVENAVFHGLEPKRDDGRVTIRIEKTSTRLFIYVKDTGIGMDTSMVSALNERLRNGVSVWDENNIGDGIGLVNICQRIHSIYGQAFGAHLSSTYGLGTEIEITLPFPADTKTERIKS
jgi:two-component system sensor histidine kinase YesM